MPDGRMLRKKISFDERLGQVSLESLLVFTWTIPHLDVKGRILGDPAYIKATIFPLIDKISIKKIKKAFKELSELELILLYGDKIKYIQFNGFLKNQKIIEGREAKSTIPDPDLLTSNSRATQDVSLKLSLKLNRSLKLKGKDQDEGQEPTNNVQPSNSDLPLPLLTEDTEPEDYENIFQVTDCIKNLLSIHCNILSPDKATLSSFVNMVTSTKQVRNQTAFKLLRDTFYEYNTLPDEKRNLKYVYSRAKGKINDALTRAKEDRAKREKDVEKKESESVNNPDILQLTNNFKIN